MTKTMSYYNILIILVISFLSNYAIAEENLFLVKDIDVYNESDTLDNARIDAVNNGTKRAFGILLDRLLPAENIWKVYNIPSNSAYDTLQDSYVTFERMTSDSYRAKIDFQFEPKKVKRILNRMGIYYTESYSPPYLLIPILIEDGKYYIWQKDEWFTAWEAMPERVGLAQFRFLLGDLLDEGTIDPKLFAQYKFKGLNALLKRYDAKEVYLIIVKNLGETYEAKIERIAPDSKPYNMTFDAKPQLNQEEFFHDMAATVLSKIDSIYKCFDTLQ